MGTNQYLYGPVQQSVEDFLSLLAFHDASQQGHTNIHAFQEIHDCLQMLFCQNFRRSHDAGLVAVVQCDEHGHESHEGFP